MPPAVVRARDAPEVLVGDEGLEAGIVGVPRILEGCLLLGEEGFELADLFPYLGVAGTELAVVGHLAELVLS